MLDHAIRATPPGGRITVRGRREGEMTVLVVQDTGRGIPPALLPRMFDLFQVSPEEARIGGGLGLALPLAKAIVERHGGHITLESAGEGQGSTITLTLPMRREMSCPPNPGTS